MKSDRCCEVPRQYSECMQLQCCINGLGFLIAGSCEVVSVLCASGSHEKISCHPWSVVTLLALSEQACLRRWVPPDNTSEAEVIITPKASFFWTLTISSASKNWQAMFIFWFYLEILITQNTGCRIFPHWWKYVQRWMRSNLLHQFA